MSAGPRTVLESGLLSPVDVHSVLIAARRLGELDPDRILGLMLTLAATRHGHTALDLASASELLTRVEELGGETAETIGPEPSAPTLPSERLLSRPLPDDLVAWRSHTLTSPLVAPRTSDGRPFVRIDAADGTPLLQTHKLARDEERLATALVARAREPLPTIARLDELLIQLFGNDHDDEAARAVRLASSGSLSIVTGGPGTGKTYSVLRLLALLLLARRESDGVAALSIRLAAPTGKAAARMAEAIAEGCTELRLDDQVLAFLRSLRGETIHQLIGLRPDGSCRHDRSNPITADVVVVDEVSMADLPLMRRLVEALPPRVRLVLLGDPDQLASVEAGRVLADLVEAPSLAPQRASFTRSRRFGHAPDIALAAAALQSSPSSNADLAGKTIDEKLALSIDLLTMRAHASTEHDPARVRWIAPGPEAAGRPTEAQLEVLAAPYSAYVEALNALPALPSDGELRALLTALDGYRLLCVHRRGPAGVEAIGREIESRLRRQAPADRDGTRLAWHGRPVLITRNAPAVELFNGDVGIVLRVGRERLAIFPAGLDGVRKVDLARLPPHEGALAMTIHKSQGSQYEHVGIVLAGRPSPIATRELVYTALTRARSRVTWLGTEAELVDALARRIERRSALATRIDAAARA